MRSLANGAEGLIYGFEAGLPPFASVVGSTRSLPATAALGVSGRPTLKIPAPFGTAV